MKRAGQPAELAPALVVPAEPLSSYVSGATIAVIGRKAHSLGPAKRLAHDLIWPGRAIAASPREG